MSTKIDIGKSFLPGAVIAACMSYAINQSILWLILHAIFGWWYAVYWLFTYTNFREWILQWVVK
jgi:hypothetical protein